MFSSISATTTRSSARTARRSIVLRPTSPPAKRGPPNACSKTRSPDRSVAATRTIVVAGAGIGGLTASLTLAAQGFRVVLLEKAERLEDAGAGLQLSPNASRILVELGLQDRLGSAGGAPGGHHLVRGGGGG